jgi:hypothetical protein
MSEHCFVKKNSGPLNCGLHNVPLKKMQIPDEMIAAGFKPFIFLVCPVSGEVLNDDGTHK